LYNIPYDEYNYFLVVDDIYDSGVTLDNIIDLLYETSHSVLGEIFDETENYFIPTVLYTQKTKEEMHDQGIVYGRRVQRAYEEVRQETPEENPWVIFPWDERRPG